MEKFDSISDQIISWVNKSESEQDGRTLIQVKKLVFEKATDEATWLKMYAHLCRKMMEQIVPRSKTMESKQCRKAHYWWATLPDISAKHEDFVQWGWVATAAAAAIEDEAIKAANKTKGRKKPRCIS
jgi:translation initiation factor 4G